MTSEIFKIIVPLGGVVVILFIGVYYGFREFLRKKIFPNLTKEQAYKLLTLFLIIFAIVIMFAISAYVYHDLNK